MRFVECEEAGEGLRGGRGRENKSNDSFQWSRHGNKKQIEEGKWFGGAWCGFADKEAEESCLHYCLHVSHQGCSLVDTGVFHFLSLRRWAAWGWCLAKERERSSRARNRRGGGWGKRSIGLLTHGYGPLLDGSWLYRFASGRFSVGTIGNMGDHPDLIKRL